MPKTRALTDAELDAVCGGSVLDGGLNIPIDITTGASLALGVNAVGISSGGVFQSNDVISNTGLFIGGNVLVTTSPLM